MRLLVVQWRAELRLMLRNGEQLLLTLGIPTLLLVFFGSVDVLPTGDDEPLRFLVPGVLALAVQSTAMVSLGIATGFERSYMVLKRLGATPLGRSRLVGAKVASVFAVELVQLAVLVPVALALGWRSDGSEIAVAVLGVLLGTAAFGGIGLTLAGRLRGEVNLAAQNGLYLVLLLVGGMVFPLSSLPGPVRAAAYGLPSGALSDVMRHALGATALHPGWSMLVLAAWGLSTPVLAASTFRWS